MRRILVVSSIYVDPANRGKLRALAARDLDVTVGVPQRWREAGLGRTLEVGWERQSGVEVFPIPVAGSGKADRLRYAGRALASLLRDKRPDLVQVEEEPGARVALQVVHAARRLKIPAVLFTRQNVTPTDGLFAAWRRARTLRRGRGAGAGGAGAGGLVREVAPDPPGARLPRPGRRVPPQPGPAAPRGPREIIGEAGVIVPPGEASALAAALRRVATPAARQPLVQAARARAMQLFSEDAIAERTLAFWREVVA